MPGDWVSIAIMSAAAIGLTNILDSHLLSKRMLSLPVFMLPIGIIILVWSLALIYLFPLPQDIGTLPLMAAIAAGVLRTAALVIMLSVMKREEVSRIIPVTNTFPIFVAIMAVPLLGEMLSYLEWIAIIIVVAGAVMISTRSDAGSPTTWLGSSFFLLVSSSLLMAMSNVTSKYALAYFSFWNVYCITHFCMSGIFLLFSLRPHVIREWGNMKRRNSAMAIIFGGEILAVIAILLLFSAMQRGPVSLVSAIVSSRPVFVLIYALIISRVSPMFLEHQRGRVMLVLRFVATTMIVSGIAIIYLV